MNDTSLDISKNIDPQKAEMLMAIYQTARKQHVPFVIAGAAARDFILENGHHIATIRATQDIDIGISVSSWNEYAQFAERLCTEAHFQKTDIEHRLESTTPVKNIVDILPFGGIENENRAIHWPQENREMNMAGFAEAYAMAEDIKIFIKPRVIIKIVSLTGLAMLKLISWNDKPSERDRDAKDFRLIMYKYLDAKPAEYVFDVHPDIAGMGDFDLISARSLGRDIQLIAGKPLLPTISDILNRQCFADGELRFVQQMQPSFIDRDPAIARDLEMLNTVRQGVADIR